MPSTEIAAVTNAKRGLTDTEAASFDVQYAIWRRDPAIAQILALIFPIVGVHRHYVGDHGVGYGQMFTLGGFFIWWFVDIFMIRGAAAERNAAIMNDIRGAITSARSDG